MKFLSLKGTTVSARTALLPYFTSVFQFRPQMKLVAKALPCGRGITYSTDAVVRTTSPGSSASTRVRCPAETCAAHLGVGANVSRPEYESIAPYCQFQRFSPGSAK